MLIPGLVSITFRQLSPREIIAACVEAKLRGIEWGGDVHVPSGDLENARAVGQMTREAGLQVAAYGSYFRCDGDFGETLQTALALGAEVIRVWAGKTDASQATPENWAEVSQYLERATALAGAAGVQVATEFHGGTLTSSGAAARRLMEASPASKTLWQPLQRAANFEPRVEENLRDLREVEPFLSNVHVYEWADAAVGERQRLPLQSSSAWPAFIAQLQRSGGTRWLLLEFVPDDDPEVLTREAAALHALIGA